jgi:multicomponent Na+:H+ antiporter subunit D
MKSLLFLVSTNLRTRLGHSDISKLDNTIRKKLPWTMAAFTVAALSMVGLPPTAGFFSKLYLVLGTFKSSNWVFLAVILLSSLLNAVYFFRILEKVYLKPYKKEDPGKGHIARDEVSSSMLIPTLILAVGIIVIGIFSYLIVNNIIELIIPAGIG